MTLPYLPAMTVTIVWFKRDLRTNDHPALALAARIGTVLPLYIAEPDLWAQPDASLRQWRFVAESLRELRQSLARLRAPLVVRVGDPVIVLDDIARKFRATRLVSHEETGTPFTFARDRRVAEWARSHGILWEELPQSGVVRRLRSRDGWAARRDAYVARPFADEPGELRAANVEDLGHIPDRTILGLYEDHCPGRQVGGRAAGVDLLQSFLAGRGRTYQRAMSSPVEGETACSRLSTHLAFGTLSIREVVQATAAARPVDRAHAASLRSFQARLAWRDHFIQKLEDAPNLPEVCLHPACEALRPKSPDRARLEAWERGETGMPFVDACMRYLRNGGWLNFRMRSMLMAVASYHLWLDWRATGPHLARMFTDYEPGNHWSQCQMQSGVTGINLPRIYNPVKQGRDQDPTGVFTRRWVPELARVPDTFLQEPWLWPEADGLLGRTYPRPIVDPIEAARAARAAVWAIRGTNEFRIQAAEVAARHASRKDRHGRFVNDREMSKPPRRPASRQLSLDL